jgi:RNA polymerase sigma-70 factor (ECF subfamily)
MNGKPTNIPDDDIRLVALAKDGDTAAFSALVERHQNKIYRFILKSVNSPADARDLTQETLLQAYRCLASFSGASRFSTWLTGIALNLTRNQVNRTPKCHFIEYNEESMSNMKNPLDDPSRHHQQKVTLGVLACAIEALPADLRECLVLIGLDGHGYEEVAQLLEVPLGTVKSRMSRARQKLRQDLAVQGFFD